MFGVDDAQKIKPIVERILSFQKPKQRVQKWIFADIDEKYHPDLVLDVSNMTSILEKSIDIILATELFEHVQFPEADLYECARVLKEDGCLILSVPFLYGIHADPFDFQRWTDVKWKESLVEAGFAIKEFHVMGAYFTVLCDHLKLLIRSFPRPLKWMCFLLYPLFDLVVLSDKTTWVQKQKTLRNMHGGYFVIASKK